MQCWQYAFIAAVVVYDWLSCQQLSLRNALFRAPPSAGHRTIQPQATEDQEMHCCPQPPLSKTSVPAWSLVMETRIVVVASGSRTATPPPAGRTILPPPTCQDHMWTDWSITSSFFFFFSNSFFSLLFIWSTASYLHRTTSESGATIVAVLQPVPLRGTNHPYTTTVLYECTYICSGKAKSRPELTNPWLHPVSWAR